MYKNSIFFVWIDKNEREKDDLSTFKNPSNVKLVLGKKINYK